MLLYLLRHADALDAENDDARPLSPKGFRQVEALGKFLRGTEAFSAAEIWHSGLVRARETATGLMAACGRHSTLMEAAELRPEDDPVAITRRFATAPASLALVGHEPHLSALASLLITGRASPVVFLFEKCTMLAVGGTGPRWAVRWQLSPQLLP